MRVRAATASRMHAATTDIVASAFAPARRLHGAHTASCYSAAAAVTCGRLCILLSRAPLLPLFQTVFRSATTLARPPTPSHRTRESSAGRTLFRPHSYPQNRSPSPIVRERVRVNPLDAASAPFGGVSKDGVGNVSELPDKSDLSKPQLPPDCVPALRQQSQDQIHIVAIARQGHKHQPHEQHQWEQQPQQQQQQHEVAPYNHADEAQEKNEAVAKASNEGDFRMNDMAPGLVLRKESMLGSRTDTAGVTTPKAMSPVALSSLMVDEMAPSEFEDIPEMDQRDVAMSQEQSFLLDTMMSGRSVYFTGKAGSGKTAVIHRFIEDARKKGKIVGVTVSCSCKIILFF
ncbi:hypothetical protein DFJ73DRAFT_444563 [Zopfochytrium polystomum]|nr:hypothetical protein DFJ73DRAFT_444563 [Zopfochytrium polystomum]